MQTTDRSRERPIPASPEPGSRAAAPALRVFLLGVLGSTAITASVAQGVLSQITDSPTVCETGRISNIFVDNRSIFQLDDFPGWARGFFGLANALHVTTRDSFILREILFAEGDCLDLLLLEESARILRSYSFI